MSSGGRGQAHGCKGSRGGGGGCCGRETHRGADRGIEEQAGDGSACFVRERGGQDGGGDGEAALLEAEAELFPGAMEAALDGSQGPVEQAGGFLVGAAFEVAENEHLLVRARQASQGFIKRGQGGMASGGKVF